MRKTKLRIIFLVQAEGRGHMTQAISLSNILRKNGHELICTFIGKSKRRQLPDFFKENIHSPVIELDSPNFVTDKDNKSINIAGTLIYNARFLGKYQKSMKLIDQKIKETNPDILINFYDFLGGFYFQFFRPKVKHVCIGHQFLADMPEFPFAPNRFIERKLFQTNNWLTSQGNTLKLALSFRPYQQKRHNNTVVVPPLMRDEIKNLKPEKKDFMLGYMVNDGYGDDIIKWHEKNRDVKIECFWDRKEVDNPYTPHENLRFHQLSGELFMEKMRTCKAYVSTAGFESICEAMYLKKPVLMIPVDGQFEQACNAIDAEKAGAGISNHQFDIQKLIDYIPHHKVENEWFKEWVASAEERILEEISRVKSR